MQYFTNETVYLVEAILTDATADGCGCSAERLNKESEDQSMPSGLADLVARLCLSESFPNKKGIGFYRAGTEPRRSNKEGSVVHREVSLEYVEQVRLTVLDCLKLKNKKGKDGGGAPLNFIAGRMGEADEGALTAALAHLPQFGIARGRGVYLVPAEQQPAAMQA